MSAKSQRHAPMNSTGGPTRVEAYRPPRRGRRGLFRLLFPVLFALVVAVGVLAGGMSFVYERVAVAPEQFAFVAVPEKALLDLVYLQPGGDDRAYLESLRLQNLDRINPARMVELAGHMNKPKLKRAAQIINELREEERESCTPV